MSLLEPLDQALRAEAARWVPGTPSATAAVAAIGVIPIVVPSYNGGQMLLDGLERLAQAIARVDLGGFFVALFDDDSSDGSVGRAAALLRRLRLRHSIIRWRHNGGEGANINQSFAFLAQRGFRWALLVHQDDLLSAECLQSVRDEAPGAADDTALIACRNLGFGNGGEDRIAAANAGIDAVERGRRRIYPGSREGLERLRSECHWLPSGTLFRLSSFLACGGFTGGLRWAADTEYLTRQTLDGGSTLYLPGVVVGHRLHDASSSTRVQHDGDDALGIGYLLWRHTATSDRVGSIGSALRHGWTAARRGVRALRAGERARARGRWIAAGRFVRLALALAVGSDRLLGAPARTLIRSARPAGLGPGQLDDFADVLAFDLGQGTVPATAAASACGGPSSRMAGSTGHTTGSMAS